MVKKTIKQENPPEADQPPADKKAIKQENKELKKRKESKITFEEPPVDLDKVEEKVVKKIKVEKPSVEDVVKKAKQPIYLGGVSRKTILYFTKNLSILLRTGSTVSESLEVLNVEVKDQFHKILQQIIDDVQRGVSLSDALAEHPKVFAELYVNIVKIGEESGNLEKNLEYLAQQLNSSYQLRKKIVGAMIYPIIILSGIFFLGTGLAIYILPKISQLFRSFKIKLPWTTNMLISLSDFMQKHGFATLMIIIATFIAVVVIRRIKVIKPFLHSIVLKTPVVGRISRHFNLSMFYRSLSILLKSGVTIDEALKVVSKTTTNMVYRNFILATCTSIKSGESLYDILHRNSKLIPPTDSQIINVGEASGTMSDSLSYIAEIHEEELNDITRNLSSIIEPVLFIFLGVVVAILAMSIITPIYSITGQFK